MFTFSNRVCTYFSFFYFQNRNERFGKVLKSCSNFYYIPTLSKQPEERRESHLEAATGESEMEENNFQDFLLPKHICKFLQTKAYLKLQTT